MDTAISSTAKLAAPSKRGIIFISYRRSDAAGYVGRISEVLTKKFKKRHVFRDLEAIAPGTDFPEAIEEALGAASVFILIIGPDWVSTRNADGQLRLSDPDDYVRREVTTALARKLRIMPVLVGGARIPLPDELPECLREIANFQAFELSNSRWDFDLNRLVSAIRAIIDPGFRFRQVGWGLAAAAILLAGGFQTRHLEREWRIEQVRQIVESGKADDDYLKSLTVRFGSENIDPRIHLYKAMAYQQLGNVDQQLAEAVLASKPAIDHGDYFVAGRAMMLSCDANGRMGLPDASADCDQALKFSRLAHDKIGEVRAMNTKASNLYRSKDKEGALKAFQEVHQFAKTNALLDDEYGALNNLGLVLQDLGDSKQALASYKAAKDGFAGRKLFGEASNACNNLATVSFNSGDIEAATRYFEEARDLASKEKGDASRQAQAYANLGLSNEQAGRLRAAENDLETALKTYSQLGRVLDVALVKNELGDVYLQMGKYAQAEQVYQESANVAGSDTQALSAVSLVNLEVQWGRVPSAGLMDNLEEAIREAEKSQDYDTQLFALRVKSRALLLMKRMDEAVEAARTSLDLAKKEDGQLDNEVAAEMILAEIRGMRGSLADALVDLQRLRDSTSIMNIGQDLEVRLVSATLMLRRGTAEQRSAANVLLPEILTEARGKRYILLAAKAQAILDGKSAYDRLNERIESLSL